MSEEQEVPYDQTTSQAWHDTVESWNWRQLEKDQWRKSGTCPRCQHQMDIPYDASTVIFKMKKMQDQSADQAYGLCNCPMPHPNRPDGESGCGPAGYFSPPSIA